MDSCKKEVIENQSLTEKIWINLEYYALWIVRNLKILKEYIYHFDPNDLTELKNFPENYTQYIERIEFAQAAYYRNNLALIDDSIFDLQR